MNTNRQRRFGFCWPRPIFRQTSVGRRQPLAATLKCGHPQRSAESTALQRPPVGRASRYARHADQRSGITLLFVISMIVLFLLMGTAFVIVANNYNRTARKRGARDIHKADQKAILETAFYDLFRGTDLSVANSPLRGHSILGDMYGYGFTATLNSASVDSSEHFLRVQLNNDARLLINQANYSPQPVPGSMTGLVLSFVSGPAQGLSTRIVDHQVTGDSSSGFNHQFVLLPHWTGTGLNSLVLSRVGTDRVIINGRPFAGTGAGYLNSTDPLLPGLSNAALQPNQTGRSRSELLGLAGNPEDAYFARVGGPNSLAPNEPYDTFDAQNMFLAGIRPDGSAIPSFHRPTLIAKAPADPRNDFRADTSTSGAQDGIDVDNDNDGRPDGIWMDIGLPVVGTADGKNIKPLVSYLVLDMESRINVNAHGSLVPLDPTNQSFIDLLAGVPAGSLPKGQGFGPADVQLDKVLPSSAGRAMRARYGPDAAPGVAGVRDDWSNYQLFGLPTGSFSDFIPGTVGGHYGSMLDIHGRFSIGYPQIFDFIAQRDGEQFPIGMPVFNIGLSRLPFESVDSPYEFSMSNDLFYGPHNFGSDDQPFTAREFESFLRPNDPDTPTLPNRMRFTINEPNKRNSVTAFGYEVPTLYENLPGRLFSILNSGIAGSGAAKDNRVRTSIRSMLPTELQRGLPMNVNRSFGDGQDNNNNGVIDEPGERNSLAHPLDPSTDIRLDLDNDAAVTNDTDAGGYRDAFMRQLYVLTLLVTERKNGAAFDVDRHWFDFNLDGTKDSLDLIEYRKRIAQWVVNVVDFRDPDSIMTAFECDLDPWNGWDMDGKTSTVEPAERFLVWGTERPELLITETFASHDTRLLDLDTEAVASGSPGLVSDGDDNDFDSWLVPKVTAFFELYNPWVVNDANQIRPAEIYDNGQNGVDLQKTALDGSPVWRLVVTQTDQKELDPDQPGSTQQFDRRIYFSRPPRRVDSGPAVYFPSTNIQSDPIAPGMYGVVGTAGQEVDGKFNNYFGRRTEGTSVSPDPLSAENLANATRRISMDPVNQSLEVLMGQPDPNPDPNGPGVIWQSSVRRVPVLPIDRTDTGFRRDLGVSDPVDGYFNIPDPNSPYQVKIEPVADGLKFIETESTGAPEDFTYDTPVDELANRDHYENFLKDRSGTQPGYRVVHLQRLANPLRRWDAQSNPYRTVDSAAIDLFVFNGTEPTAYDPNEPVLFSTLERRKVANGDAQEVAANQHRLLFRGDLAGNTNASSEASSNENTAKSFRRRDGHLLTWNLIESLGRINTAYREAGLTDQQPFAAIAWHNRPFVSQYELAEVSFLSSSQLTRRFGNADRSRDVYNLESPASGAEHFDLLSAQFPHLLSFYADRVDFDNGPALHRLMDFTETPSRFLGTESFVNPTGFIDDNHGISFGLAPPFDRISSYRYPGKINVNTILDSSVWDAICSEYASGGLQDQVSFSQWTASRRGAGINSNFDNPLRPAYAFNFVGPDGLAPSQEPSDCGLFRKDGGDPPLFDYAPDANNKLPALDVDRAAQIRFALRERLGNLVTNRSSVFAVWISTGFFESNADGTLIIDGNSIKEYGTESGTARRGRAFYMVDRSIPVAFEPGKNHNVDRAVLIKSFIEHSDQVNQP